MTDRGPASASRGAGAPPRALVLAAGHGTRLRPVTDHLPKPLLPVGGRPLLDLVLENLARAGVEEAAVNTHHLGERIEAFAAARGGRPRVTLFPESEILGTGGPLANAREFLSASESFLLHNGDVLCDLDPRALLAEHARTGALATLALADWPEVNTVGLSPEGVVISIGEGAAPALRGAHAPGEGVPAPAPASAGRLTYAGIAIFRREFLDLVPPGPSSLVTALRRALAERPGSVRGFALGGYWNDLGTAARYVDALAEAQVPGRIALPALAPGERITGHGSERRFRRVREGTATVVRMEAPPDDEEFDRFVAVGRFLSAHGFGGPEILDVDRERRVVVMEDLGRESLFVRARAGGGVGHDRAGRGVGGDRGEGAGAEGIADAYGRAVDRLVDLQTRGDRLVLAGACPEASDRVFDHATLRWETDYFRERFLGDFAGVPETERAALDGEFEALARAAREQPAVLMHRDFQSQNIFLAGGEARLIDFQGMRRGPLLYDLMSLLRDAYVDLGEDLRRTLGERYRAGLAAGGGPVLTDHDLERMGAVAGLQRNMQALGAFASLALGRDKMEFLGYIPLGLRHLREGLRSAAALAGTPDLPRLRATVEAVAGRLLPPPDVHG